MCRGEERPVWRAPSVARVVVCSVMAWSFVYLILAEPFGAIPPFLPAVIEGGAS